MQMLNLSCDKNQLVGNFFLVIWPGSQIIIVMPLLIQMFLDTYGWRGTMLLLAGLNSNLIMCGALLRPLQTDNVASRDKKTFEIQHNHQESTERNLFYYLDLVLFTDADFISMLVYSFGSAYCFTGWMIYLVPHALELGFEPYESSFLASIGGIFNFLASICYPIIKMCLSDKFTLYVSTLLMTLALGMDPLVSSYRTYLGLAILSGIFVFARGVATMSVAKLVKNIVGDDMIANAILWNTVAHNIGCICGGFVSGKLGKTENS